MMRKRKGHPVYPLTAAQKFHFFYQNFCPKKEVLNIGTSLTIEMELDMELLKKAIYQAYDRCEAMRLRFAQDKQGTWYQYVADKEERDIEYVDFSNGTLLINKQHGKVKGTKEYRFSSLKNDKPRLLTVADAVMDALRHQKVRQKIWKDVAGSAWDNPDNLVFTTELGRYLCNQTVYLAFKKVVKSLGLEEVRFHDLRHTFAVNSLKSGDDIKTVQENLGHHTAAFTLDTYAHVTSGMKKSSASRMDQYIKSVTTA